MSIKHYKPLHTMCFVTELMSECTAAIQNRSKIHVVVLRSSTFFSFMSRQVRLNFWFSVSWREKRQRI